MREITVDEFKTLSSGTKVYLGRTDSLMIIDGIVIENKLFIIPNEKIPQLYRKYIDCEIICNIVYNNGNEGYKIYVDENPYEKIWNDLKEEINSNIHYLKDKDKYWPKEDKERFICTYKNTLEIMRRLEKENRINVDFFVKK